jgi:GABA permease
MAGAEDMGGPRAGQVHKVVRVVATSGTSWEDAARQGVAEAVKTIDDLGTATVVEADAVVRDGAVAGYRVKLEMAFQLDRSRLAGPGPVTVEVRRYLVVANQTLPSQDLAAVLAEKVAAGPAEFHVLVPEGLRTVVFHDPTELAAVHVVEIGDQERLLAMEEAEKRLDSFRNELSGLGARLTGEVGFGDPMSAVHRVMERSSFDEIIVSTLPVGLSRWLKLDLPARLERAFKLPVTHLVQELPTVGGRREVDES